MRIVHAKCNYPVEIVTERVAVKVIEVAPTGDGSLEPILMDLVQLRSGKYLFSCPSCKEDLDPKIDLALPCPRCGNNINLNEVYSIMPDWYLLCKDCYMNVAKKLSSDPNIEIKLEPGQLKLK